jgi:hypothetical protein
MKKNNLVEGKIYHDNHGDKWKYISEGTQIYYHNNILHDLFLYIGDEKKCTTHNNLHIYTILNNSTYSFCNDLHFIGLEEVLWIVAVSLKDKVNLL